MPGGAKVLDRDGFRGLGLAHEPRTSQSPSFRAFSAPFAAGVRPFEVVSRPFTPGGGTREADRRMRDPGEQPFLPTFRSRALPLNSSEVGGNVLTGAADASRSGHILWTAAVKPLNVEHDGSAGAADPAQPGHNAWTAAVEPSQVGQNVLAAAATRPRAGSNVSTASGKPSCPARGASTVVVGWL